MPEAGGADKTPRPRTLPARDFILLPLVVLVTLATILTVMEGLARATWPERQKDSCEVRIAGHSHMTANCRSVVKVAEGAWVENRYNACGYRSAAPCGPKPAGTLRVVVLGTSVSRGYWVAYDDSFSGRLERQLKQACGRPVEFQNLSIGAAIGPIWHTAADRVNEAVALSPDALVLVVTPFDLQGYTAMPRPEGAPAPPAGPKRRAPKPSLGAEVANLKKSLTGSRASLVAMHYFYSDMERYVPLYLKHGDEADFLRPPFSPAWRLRLEVADATVAAAARAAQAAGAPLIVLYNPNRAQFWLAQQPAGKFPGVDPFAIGHALADIAHRHGAQMVDVTDFAKAYPDIDSLYYPVDGHPTGQGHKVIAQALGASLASYAPAFRGCAPMSTASLTPAEGVISR